MMRRQLLCLVVGIVAHTVLMGATDWTAVVQPLTHQVPRLEILHEDGTKGVCSGVVINAERGFLLTAAHCVAGKPEEMSITVNERHAQVARVNRLLDLAVLRFQPKDEVTMRLAERSPAAGTPAAMAGYSFAAAKLSLQFGHVAQTYNQETKTIWLNVTSIGGCSGGPVVDDHGRLIGMTSRVYYAGPSSMGAAIPVEAIADFVQPYLPK